MHAWCIHDHWMTLHGHGGTCVNWIIIVWSKATSVFQFLLLTSLQQLRVHTEDRDKAVLSAMLFFQTHFRLGCQPWHFLGQYYDVLWGSGEYSIWCPKPVVFYGLQLQQCWKTICWPPPTASLPRVARQLLSVPVAPDCPLRLSFFPLCTASVNTSP